MKNVGEMREKTFKLDKKLEEKKLCKSCSGLLYYIKYSFDEMEKPISYVEYKFDETKYVETGFFLVCDIPDARYSGGEYFFTDENCNLVVPCLSLQNVSPENRDWYYITHNMPMSKVMKILANDLSYNIAKNPKEASKIPAKTFGAFPSLDEKILACYKQIKLKELASTNPNSTEFNDNIRKEVSMLNEVFNQKERELSGWKLDGQLFARDKSL